MKLEGMMLSKPVKQRKTKTVGSYLFVEAKAAKLIETENGGCQELRGGGNGEILVKG